MPFNYCPNCARPSISTDNGHQFDCSDCGYQYFHNAAAAVAGIILCQEQILFTRRANDPCAGMLDLPGGFVDHNESLEQALIREVQEELGIEVRNWRYLMSASSQYVYRGIRYFTCDGIFIAQIPHKPQITLQQSELADAVWLNKHQLNIDEIAFESQRRAIELFWFAS